MIQSNRRRHGREDDRNLVVNYPQRSIQDTVTHIRSTVTVFDQEARVVTDDLRAAILSYSLQQNRQKY